MPNLKVLFIGGTGVISSACAERALAVGIDLTVLNRGSGTPRPVAAGAEPLHADIRDPDAARRVLRGREFDAVVDFVAFTPDHVRADIELFRDRTRQFVFIGSASAYQTPPARLPITESTPLRNPYWQYSRDKIACEDVLIAAYRDTGFPVTIVRPSHTYDRTSLPLVGKGTALDRIRRGREVVVPGDGTSLWTLTHNTDFARAFVGLLGHPQAIGDSFHITSDEALTWNQIYEMVGAALGVEPRLAHVTSETIAAAWPPLGPGLLGDKAHSMVFDNSKVKTLVPDFVATVPFAAGVREIVAWHDIHPDHAPVDPELDAVFDRLVTMARGVPEGG